MSVMPTRHSDTLARRWAALEPHSVRYGPADRDRPLALLFHGCGGVRGHLARYAEAAAAVGCEAVVVDSFAPRGFGRAYALATVCTGMVLKGRERAGDVLAAAWGLTDGGRSGRPMVMAGWSHGSWAMMDLMTMPLTSAGEAGLTDPDPGPLRGLKGLFLAYPYGGIGALSRVKPWRRAPAVSAIAPTLDHVTSRRDVARCYRQVRAAGGAFEIWEPRATHAFDEPKGAFPMRHDPALTQESLRRFGAFIAEACLADSPASA